MKYAPGDVISHLDMSIEEGTHLQRGMNFHLGGHYSVLLMSVRDGAPYSDRVEDEGRILIYEGHDIPRKRGGPDPKTVDQPLNNQSGTPTQNGKFFKAAMRHKEMGAHAEKVRVYEKIMPSIWTYNGLFALRDAWLEESDGRKVCKFRLELLSEEVDSRELEPEDVDLLHTRMIPPEVKRVVWRRDQGKCVTCGATNNLHFDHIVPYSKGGTSLDSRNIQLLCARHNLEKRDKIQ